MMAVASILETIAAHKRREIAAAKAVVPLHTLKEQARRAPPTLEFRGTLERAGFSVIAEIKQASPSAGQIREVVEPAEIARQYVAGGARAISVVTDRHFFGGSPEHLKTVRAAVSVPVLRKDFILEAYQVHESRVLGADAVLLIAALLDQASLRELLVLAASLAMEALVEVHTEGEVEQALAADADLIGINNRDLRTFEVDLDTTARLRTRIPPGVLVVSESGISTPADVARVRPYADAILVGTTLMASDDPAAMIRALLNGGITP